MKFLVAALLLVMAHLCLAKDKEAQFESLADARKSFADRKLCFIGVLEDYTDLAGDEVNPDQDIVQGVRFSILWSAKEPKPANYWMHICFEPTSGEIFGERKKTYAVTLEGGAKFGGADVDAWPGCAWAFKFTPISLKQAPAVAPKR
jgi:hypothetical protein